MDLVRTFMDTSSLESTKRSYEVSNCISESLSNLEQSKHATALRQNVFPVGGKTHSESKLMLQVGPKYPSYFQMSCP